MVIKNNITVAVIHYHSGVQLSKDHCFHLPLVIKIVFDIFFQISAYTSTTTTTTKARVFCCTEESTGW